MTPGGEDLQFDWRRGGAAAGALIATLILLAMVVLVAISNQARDRALEGERHAYDVSLLTRSVDASIARAEAALGRFVLDEDEERSGVVAVSDLLQKLELIAVLGICAGDGDAGNLL